MGDRSHICRILPSHREDEGRTLVRMERSDMARLGIQEGDIVRIGVTKDTAAICLGTDQSHEDGESGIECLNNSTLKDYPSVRLSSEVLSNAGAHLGIGSLVNLSRISPGNELSKATKIILSAAREARNVYGWDYEKRIDFTKYLGNIISKGDRVSLPLVSSDKWKHFFSEVLDVEPPSKHNAWMVQPDTKFEIKETGDHGSNFSHSDVTKLVELTRVVPIVKKVEVMEDLSLTVPFLEIYENGSKIFFYLTERIHRIETVNVNGIEMRQPAQKIHGLPMANMEITDDRGNSYLYVRADIHNSGTTFPSTAPDWEFFSRYTLSFAFWPPINNDTKELRILVKEFFWSKHLRFHLPPPSQQGQNGQEKRTKIEESQRHVMTPVRPSGFAILTGPWEFKVQL